MIKVRGSWKGGGIWHSLCHSNRTSLSLSAMWKNNQTLQQYTKKHNLPLLRPNPRECWDILWWTVSRFICRPSRPNLHWSIKHILNHTFIRLNTAPKALCCCCVFFSDQNNEVLIDVFYPQSPGLGLFSFSSSHSELYSCWRLNLKERMSLLMV